MSIGSLNNYLLMSQGMFGAPGTSRSVFEQMSSLATQRQNASHHVQSFLDSLGGSRTPSLNESMFTNLGNVNKAANDLRTQASQMSSLSAFSSSVGRTASSSDGNVLTAEVSKGAPVSNFTRTSVDVQQLAAGQQNQSASLNTNENSFGDRFSLSITDNAGRTSDFQVDLTDSSDNRSAMQAMAAEINASDTGVRATVVEDKESGTVSMRLDSTRTGETEGRFTVADDSAAALSTVQQESRNAEYAVNGVNFTSQTNEVRLQDGVTATLRSEGTAEVRYQADTSAAVNSVQRFADAFNQLRNATTNAPTIGNRLTDVANNFGRALDNVGLGMDAKGNLSITDESRLSQSISDGSFARTFQGTNSFGDRVNSVARDAYRTAYDAAVQSSFRDMMDTMNTMNIMNNSRNSSALAMMNSMFSSSGLLFNMLA